MSMYSQLYITMIQLHAHIFSGNYFVVYFIFNVIASRRLKRSHRGIVRIIFRFFDIFAYYT